MSASVCDEDSGTLYVFVKSSSLDYSDDEYDAAPGFDKIGNYGNLTALALAQAADASQYEGGYLANRTLSQTFNFLTGNLKPKDNLLINIPVCELDVSEDSFPSSEDTWRALKEGAGGSFSTDDEMVVSDSVSDLDLYILLYKGVLYG
jgi:hypothetical protein